MFFGIHLRVNLQPITCLGRLHLKLLPHLPGVSAFKGWVWWYVVHRKASRPLVDTDGFWHNFARLELCGAEVRVMQRDGPVIERFTYPAQQSVPLAPSHMSPPVLLSWSSQWRWQYPPLDPCLSPTTEGCCHAPLFSHAPSSASAQTTALPDWWRGPSICAISSPLQLILCLQSFYGTRQIT